MMKPQLRKRAGFTLVELMIVVAIIGLLGAIAIPNYVNARVRSQTNLCIDNLRVLDAAKQQWALDEGRGGNSVPTAADLFPYFYRDGNLPLCPNVGAGGTFDASYEPNGLLDMPECLVIPVTHVFGP